MNRTPGARRPAGAVPSPDITAPDASRGGRRGRGVPRAAEGTPVHGVPRFGGGTPAHGAPQARGGHPEQREPGGGWGEMGGRTDGGRTAGAGAPGAAGVFVPRQRHAAPSGPRQDYVDAFGARGPDDADAADDDDVFTPRAGTGAGDRRPQQATQATASVAPPGDAPPTGPPAQSKGGKGRAFTGIAAAAVTTVLAVIVAGQVTDDHGGSGARSQSAADRADRDIASRGNGRATPSVVPGVAPLTYAQRMGKKYPLAAQLKGSGKFEVVPGTAKAPHAGKETFTYRVDVEQGLDLDAELFARAVQITLNDDRSWAHRGARAFERVDSGKPDFVVTLASPGTTADWCARSDLDTAEENVSCNSYKTNRVMINAYRWAQGSETYGDAIYAYRQMLINHEVGHRLGHDHVTCDRDGQLAPVMQQQTKFLNHDGIHCLPNPWPYPKS
ncbi:DUF3152 domain-containing protein [Streptomyces sp. NPDC086787]|uniref:DUF3152 domain-containing protein n=1 Tax=Streptomyces sp. NPDC086787 TaxID=3365759 RepID=UPI0037FEDDFB